MAGKKGCGGRQSYYKTRIEPRLKEIKEWLSLGLTEQQVYRNLGVGHSTWYAAKAKYPEFQEAIREGVLPVVIKVRSALYKSAVGFTYTERRVYQRPDKETGEAQEVVEISEKYSPPNVASCNLLLKNLDKDNWANDPQSLRLRELELKHKQQMAESALFSEVEDEPNG